MATHVRRTSSLAACALALLLSAFAVAGAAEASPVQGVDPSCADPQSQYSEDDDADGECSDPQPEPAIAQQDQGSLYSAASAELSAGNVAQAVQDYRGIVEAAPQDANALMYLAGWSTFLSQQGLGDTDDVDLYKSQLETADPARGVDLDRMLTAIQSQASAPLSEEVPAADSLRGAATTIVTLGAGLRPDGSMPQVLLERLKKTLDLALADPEASIIVTGGKPQNGLTEADAMADWLVGQGVDPARVHKEDRSASTVQNALNSASILRSLKPSQLVVVTSANHARRASALLELVAQTALDPGFDLISVASVDPAQAGYDESADPQAGELRAMYRDSFSVVRPGM
ncbi:protein of unknown function DUF218 [Segniliparus rotundus DSM 44985]|uniref:DUF218 domain-containing protein n=1 Tax=Segniliparus rotundus (strain ATCC BAA-972 / CDC 1076 / CIP 108378 / DSM 44985 / JCM 13578) TaxID=640132 RepID=D6ZEW9_SEGRD|nr:YdcF family protein [Segniliparus rotundus]ADG97493.1 protein of unknown function DUF218 [Segniliparus rotundus DSM 44985]